MRLSVTSTTGSGLELSVPRGETVEGLKTNLSQKLKLPRSRIVLLHKNRQLNAGKLLDLGVADESKLTLVPTVEAGLACQTSRTERTIVQALESLTEVQISDFLSGRSPLTLSLGIGAHMMYVQLQLAEQNVAGQQQHRHPGAWSGSKVQAGLAEATSMTHPGSTSTSTPSSTNHPASPTSPPSQTLSPAPRSPSPTQTNDHALSTAKLCEQPGAVIETFVNHSPGVFSGTFSGSLDPISQSGTNHPRRGIAIILQILNDLFSATCHHQGAPPTLPQLHCLAPRLPVSPLLTTVEPSKATSDPLVTHMTESRHFSRATGVDGYPQQSSTEENLTLRCKLEQLQFLMHQRRLRRQTRSGTNPSKTSHPYQRHYHHPWSPGRQRTTSPDDLKLQVTEEPPWKPEMTSDLVVV
ncbi:midnolin-like [Diretmus argenteus]